MDIQPIRSKAAYEAALHEVEQLSGSINDKNQDDSVKNKIEILKDLIEHYKSNLEYEELADYGQICEGYEDKELGKKVAYLIIVTKRFTVYLDTKHDVQWRGDVDTSCLDAAEILNIITRLTVATDFLKEDIKFTLRRQIGEVWVRVFEKNFHQAKEMCKIIEDEVNIRNQELAWTWYFTTSSAIVAVSVILIVLEWIFRKDIISLIGTTAFRVIFCAAIGSIGAFISICLRNQLITLNARAGLRLHIAESIARISVGSFSSLIVALSIKSGVLLSEYLGKSNAFSGVILLCLLAGASERFLPSMIKRFDENIDSTSKQPINHKE